MFDVKRLDIYRKIPKDLTQQTYTGALISVICTIFMVLLFLSELAHYLSGEILSDLYVDNPGESSERIPVFIKISLPRMKCDHIGLDIQDDNGRHEVGFIDDTKKIPLGSDNEGCLFEARFQIDKVPGNFHVSTHSKGANQPESIDFAHEILEVRFGENLDSKNLLGSFNTLKSKKNTDANAMESHEYFMKIVPTIYVDTFGGQKISYQYTYASKSYISFGLGGRTLPAIWFRYDLNPITVRYHVKRPPFYSFITTICAIVGGTFTVAGIVDSFLFTASEIFKKFEIGKLS